MKKLISVLLKGEIESDIVYPISLIEQVNEGAWEMCITTLGFTYTSEDVVPVSHVAISSNFVLGKSVNDRNEPCGEEAVLNLCIYGNKKVGAKTIIGMRQQTFFAINNAQQNLKLTLRNAATNERLSGSNVVVQVLLRRIA